MQSKFVFLGGHAALDFANTLVKSEGRLIEGLGSWSDVVDWLLQAGISSDAKLTVATARRKRALNEVVRLRQAWSDELSRIVQGGVASDRFLLYLNSVISEITYTEALHRRADGRFQLVRSESTLHCEQWVMTRLAQQIASLLVDADFAQLRQCANVKSCALYFYDDTKNHRRQWCSASTCGNRHKVAAFRRRKKRSRGNAES